MRPLTDHELIDKLLLHKIPGGGVFICDVCGSYANSLADLRHKDWCPDREVSRGD